MPDNLLFPTQGLSEEEEQFFNDIYNKLKSKFEPQFDLDFKFDFKKFNFLKDKQDSDFEYALSLSYSDSKATLSFPAMGYCYGGNKGGECYACEYQTWGIVELQNNFGHVIIKAETIEDRIEEFLRHDELKFEDDKQFNKEFYVLTSDKDKTLPAMKASFRNAIMDIQSKDIFIEIIDHTLVIGNKQCCELEMSYKLAEFIIKVSSLH